MPQLNNSILKENVHYYDYISSGTNSTTYHKSPSPSDNLWQSALLYYIWQVSRFSCDYIASLGSWRPFWATVEVVPWLLAPITSDMTQVLPGIQSTSLPGLFRSNQGFYFLWVILYFLCREFYWIPIHTILGDVSFFSTWITRLGVRFNWFFFGCVLHLFLHHRFF